MLTRSVVKLVAGMALISALYACNTVAGVGEDLNAAGRGLSRSAESAKEKM